MIASSEFPTCVVLAGGLGTRLRKTVSHLPKSVAPVAGQPFLLHLLNQFWQAGSRRIVLCTGYRSDEVIQEIGRRFEDAEILYSHEDQPLGTGGALRLAWLRYGEDKNGWLVTNGDSYCDIALNEFWHAHRNSGLDATLASVEVGDGSRYGSLAWDEARRVTKFGEKEEKAATRWINAGVYAFTRQFLESLSPIVPLSLEREVFPGWIAHGIHVVAGKARFIDIGTPDSYSAAQEFFAEKTI